MLDELLSKGVCHQRPRVSKKFWQIHQIELARLGFICGILETAGCRALVHRRTNWRLRPDFGQSFMIMNVAANQFLNFDVNKRVNMEMTPRRNFYQRRVFSATGLRCCRWVPLGNRHRPATAVRLHLANVKETRIADGLADRSMCYGSANGSHAMATACSGSCGRSPEGTNNREGMTAHQGLKFATKSDPPDGVEDGEEN